MAADPVVLTVQCTCRLGSHTLTVPPAALTNGGTVTAYCAATGQLYYANVDHTDQEHDDQ